MTSWLTPEWFDETRALAADLPARPGLSGRIQFEVTGGPDGDAAYHWELEDGRLLGSGGGAIDAPDAVFTAAWSDASAVERGELDPNVAFMRGRLKAAGSMDLVLALLPATRAPEVQDLRRRIAAVTEF